MALILTRLNTADNNVKEFLHPIGVALGIEVDDKMSQHECYEYFGPDYTLHVSPSNMENKNSHHLLEEIRSKVRENLSKLQHAPSVQFQERPPDSDLGELIPVNLMQSYPARALDRRLQVDWARDARKGPKSTKFCALLFLSLHSSPSSSELLSMASYGGELLLDLSSPMMQSYPARALDRKLQVDWARDAREGPRVLMSLRTHLLLEVASPLSFPFSIPLPFIFQEAKESIDEEDPRPTSSNGACIMWYQSIFI
ncbi:Histone deacetylase 19 [Glycine soja]|uniref:Histone deacetylase 19 n=1 Tax=Glycine soja TaxID=3848 RepID=A0A445HR29_GLYSO|nr:Histone deacetylase 19 [Glycine soja]